MTLTIHKEQLSGQDIQTLLLPAGARILSCQVQYGQPHIWYLCDPYNPKEERKLRIAGTGHPIDISTKDKLHFISTFQMQDGKLVFHLFEILDEGEGEKEVETEDGGRAPDIDRL